MDEFVVLELHDPSPNAAFVANVPVLRSTGVILDDDGAGSNLSLFVSNPVLLEPDAGQQFVRFDITLSRPATSDLYLDYATSDMSAIAGQDYVDSAGTVLVTQGSQTAFVFIPVLGDMTSEQVEHFALTVTPPPGSDIATFGATGIVQLIDTDTSPLPEISVEAEPSVEASLEYLRFTVSLSEASLQTVSVKYRVLPGSGNDQDLRYSTTNPANNGTLYFAPGKTTATLLIEPASDEEDEWDESIVLELFDPNPNAVFEGGLPVLRETGIIYDDDGAADDLAVFVSNPILIEGDNAQINAVFEILLSRPQSEALTFGYTTQDISAEAGSDYIAQAGNVTFAPGQTLQVVMVPVVADVAAEPVEQFGLIVTPPNEDIGVTAAFGTATLLDTDTSPLPEISVTGGQTFEASGAKVRFTVTLSEASTQAVTMDYRLLTGTAGDTDLRYIAASSANNGSLAFLPGETSKSILIEMAGDDLDELDETFQLELFNAGPNAVFSVGAPALLSTGFILDDEGTAPNGVLHVRSPTVVETDTGQSFAVFHIDMSRPADQAFDLIYETVDASAKAGSDYVAMSGTITVLPGQLAASVAVPILGDDVAESAELFSLLVTPSNELAPATGQALILDTDTSDTPQVTITGGATVEGEYHVLRYVVTLSNPSLQETRVDWSVGGGTATASDLRFGLQSGTLVFAPGDTSHSLFVTLRDDSLNERDESLFVQLSNPVNGTFAFGASEAAAAGFILDNDGISSNRAIALALVEVTEPASGVQDVHMAVRLSQPSSVSMTFDASLMSDNATAGDDVTLLDESITFLPGQTSAAIGLRVHADEVEELTETLQVALSPAVGTLFFGTIDPAFVLINDGTVDTSPDPVNGTNGDDEMTGTLENDLVFLRAGNDTYDGLSGDDDIRPGPGDDNIDGGPGVDTVTYTAATGGITVYLEYSGADIGGGEGADTLTNIENLTGSAFDDRLIGDAGNNVLRGWTGNDVLKGKGGDDLFFGADGDDRIRAEDGADILYGGDGSDILTALAGDDVLHGDAGRDFMYGGRGSDEVNGGAGDDVLRGNLGNDLLYGGLGADDLRGGGSNDVLIAGSGDDFLFGQNGSDRLDGGAGDDVMSGASGGGTLDNTRDTFVFGPATEDSGGYDRIKDFEDGIDQIELVSFGFSDFGVDVVPLAADQFGGVWVDFGAGDVLFIENMALNQFDETDVILV